MLALRPLAAVQDSPGLVTRIPRELLALAGARAPWTSYVAFRTDGVAVGTCAFKSPPTTKKEVEIAYLTFPEFEKQGHGTAMARALVEIAAGSGEVDSVIAQTLREEDASVHICRRLDFAFEGEVLDPEDGPVWRWRKPTGLARATGGDAQNRK
jgi:ribosomal-protein-alanine N-acetyltransferase